MDRNKRLPYTEPIDAPRRSVTNILFEDENPAEARITTDMVTSQTGALQDEEANELVDTTDVRPPVGMRDFITSEGYFEYQRNSRFSELSQERMDQVGETQEGRTKTASQMVRAGALAQGIQAVADLFTLRQKNNDPAVIGAKHGARLSQEGIARLDAERIIYDKELEAHYNRLFQDAARDEQIEQANTQLANQIKQQNLTAQLRALTETIQGYESGNNPEALGMARASMLVQRLFESGQHEAGIELGKQLGVFDEDLNVNFNEVIRRTGGAGNIQPQQELTETQRRANEVALMQYDQMEAQISQQRQRVNQLAQEMGGQLPEDHPDRKRLEQMEQELGNLRSVPAVQEHEVNRMWNRNIGAPQAMQAVINADVNNPEAFDQAVDGYVEALKGAGYSQQQAMQMVEEAIGYNTGNRIRGTIQRFQRNQPTDAEDAQVRREAMISELVSSGVARDRAEQIANEIVRFQSDEEQAEQRQQDQNRQSEPQSMAGVVIPGPDAESQVRRHLRTTFKVGEEYIRQVARLEQIRQNGVSINTGPGMNNANRLRQQFHEMLARLPEEQQQEILNAYGYNPLLTFSTAHAVQQ